VNYCSPDLRNLEFDDIQLVRFWRNLDHIRHKMVETCIIDRDSQRNWFNEINSDFNKYFVYSFGSKDVGVVNLTKINQETKSFEAGIFCGDLSFLGHWINLWACLKVYDYAFNKLDLSISFATILKDNDPALNLNMSLGYFFISDDKEGIGRFILTRENYTRNSEKIRKYLNNFLEQNI